MTDGSNTYKRAKAPRKRQPVKNVTLSEDARRAYEDMMKQRDERERSYATHLGPQDRPR
jgi:hypothetical protein